MKVLRVADLHFLLPEDFDGSLADALRLLACFVESEHAASLDATACFGSTFGAFNHNVKQGARLTARCVLAELTADGWQKRPLGIAEPVSFDARGSCIK